MKTKVLVTESVRPTGTQVLIYPTSKGTPSFHYEEVPAMKTEDIDNRFTYHAPKGMRPAHEVTGDYAPEGTSTMKIKDDALLKLKP